jgi:hypothetical protein
MESVTEKDKNVTSEADKPPPRSEEVKSAFLSEDKKSTPTQEDKEESSATEAETATDEQPDVEENDELNFSGEDIVLLTLPRGTNEASKVELESFPVDHFDDHPVAYLDGRQLFPYQQLAGPHTGFWNVVVVAPSGKGKTSYLKSLALLNNAVKPGRSILYISSKLDTSSFLSPTYKGPPESIAGEFEEGQVTVLRTNEPGNLEKINRLRDQLPAVLSTIFKDSIVLVDDLLETDPAFEALQSIRDTFILTGRQAHISVGYSAHLVSGYQNRDVRNEANTIVVRYEHGNFVPATVSYLENNLKLKRTQISRLRRLISEPVPGHDPPLRQGWVCISSAYNVVIAGSRVISLSYLMGDKDASEEKEGSGKEEERQDKRLPHTIISEDEDSKTDEENDPPPPKPGKRKKKEVERPVQESEPPKKRTHATILACSIPGCRYMTTERRNYNAHRRQKHPGEEMIEPSKY